MENLNLSSIRKDYQQSELDEKSVHENPLVQFGCWMNEALKSDVPEPTAMLLTTVGKDLKPSARVVLLKEVDQEGFTFFSNYESRKGMQISENPHVAMTFFWKELERQVRIEGKAIKIDPKLSDEYFHSRPFDSRLSAASSLQSRKVAGREELESQKKALKIQFPLQNIPRPANWGGYKVIPANFEFWQGRASRLHDRILYELADEGKWVISRLAP